MRAYSQIARHIFSATTHHHITATSTPQRTDGANGGPRSFAFRLWITTTRRECAARMLCCGGADVHGGDGADPRRRCGDGNKGGGRSRGRQMRFWRDIVWGSLRLAQKMCVASVCWRSVLIYAKRIAVWRSSLKVCSPAGIGTQRTTHKCSSWRERLSTRLSTNMENMYTKKYMYMHKM